MSLDKVAQIYGGPMAEIELMGKSYTDFAQQIEDQESRVRTETEKLLALHRNRPAQKIEDYVFSTAEGPASLSSFFGDKSELILIHNMGKGCVYCTLWGDGLVGFTQHLEDGAALVMVNSDSPETQKAFATERGWTFKMASAANNSFIRDMGFYNEKSKSNNPGVSIFTKTSDGTIYRKSSASFGPGDIFCSIWSFFGMLPSERCENWTPKFKYPTSETFRFSSNIALQVENEPEALAFYQNVMGFALDKSSEAECGIAIRKNGVAFWLSSDNSPNPTFKGSTWFEFVVDDLPSAISTLVKNGCTLGHTTEDKTFKGQMIEDPFGMKFHLYQPIKK